MRCFSIEPLLGHPIKQDSQERYLRKLTDLLNLGPVLAGNLQRAGIQTLEALWKLGVQRGLRIRRDVDLTACFRQFNALTTGCDQIK